MNSPRELSEDEHIAVATETHARWQAGESKSAIEIDVWGNATGHGEKFTSYVRRWLGVETEKKANQIEHIEHLEALLRTHGVSPTDAGDLEEQFRLLAKDLA